MLQALDTDQSGDIDIDELRAAWRTWFGAVLKPVRALLIIDVQVCGVLCAVYCALCAAYYILRGVCCELHPARCVLRGTSCALCALCYILRAVCSVLHPARGVLCALLRGTSCALCAACYILRAVCCVLRAVSYILRAVCCALCAVYCVVHPARCVQNDFIDGSLSLKHCPAGQDGAAIVPVRAGDHASHPRTLHTLMQPTLCCRSSTA